MAAVLLVLGVAAVASRHYGPGIGLIAGAVQATTAWTALRGRLADADILLACLITWAIAAFDRMIEHDDGADPSGTSWRRARWAFFVLLGLTSMVKGIGFGAVLIVAIVAVAIAVAPRPRDDATADVPGRLDHRPWCCRWPGRWRWSCGTASVRGALDDARGRPAVGASGRVCRRALVGVRAGPPDPGDALDAPGLVGAWRSLRRAVGAGAATCADNIPAAVVAGDRLLWAWSAAPLALLSMATVKNAHYAIAAQVPWSIWAALGLSRLAGRLVRRGWTPTRLRRAAIAGFAALGLAYGLGFWLLGPRLDRRGVEWAFYESAARLVPAGAPVDAPLRRLGPQPL